MRHFTYNHSLTKFIQFGLLSDQPPRYAWEQGLSQYMRLWENLRQVGTSWSPYLFTSVLPFCVALRLRSQSTDQLDYFPELL